MEIIGIIIRISPGLSSVYQFSKGSGRRDRGDSDVNLGGLGVTLSHLFTRRIAGTFSYRFDTDMFDFNDDKDRNKSDDTNNFHAFRLGFSYQTTPESSFTGNASVTNSEDEVDIRFNGDAAFNHQIKFSPRNFLTIRYSDRVNQDFTLRDNLVSFVRFRTFQTSLSHLFSSKMVGALSTSFTMARDLNKDKDRDSDRDGVKRVNNSNDNNRFTLRASLQRRFFHEKASLGIHYDVNYFDTDREGDSNSIEHRVSWLFTYRFGGSRY